MLNKKQEKEKRSNQKKSEQIGIPFGTASGQLRKELLFKYVKLAGDNICHQCNLPIEDIKQFSIEHKIPYLDSDNPNKLFFDLNNISFSHLSCNAAASRRKEAEHGTTTRYRDHNCRCDLCKEANRKAVYKFRATKKLKENNN